MRVRGGATLALADGNGYAITNYRRKVVEGLPPDAIEQPFRDQLLYVEAESVRPRPEEVPAFGTSGSTQLLGRPAA